MTQLSPQRLPRIIATVFLLVLFFLTLPFVTDYFGLTVPPETSAGVMFPRVPLIEYMADFNWNCPSGYWLSAHERKTGGRENTRWFECINDAYVNPQAPILNWTYYCTGGDPINPWQWWRYSDDLGSRVYEYVRAGTTADGCVPPPPDKIDYTCAPDGSSATVTWDPVAGTDRFALRFAGMRYDQCTPWAQWGWWWSGSCNHEDARAYTATFPLNVDGTGVAVTNKFWIHSRSPGGNSGDEYGVSNELTFSCPVPPPPPTNGAHSCSPGGEEVTITWTNPTGYDQSYFRISDPYNQLTSLYRGDPQNSNIYSDANYKTTYSFAVTPGVTHWWRAYTKNSITGFASTGYIEQSFECPLPPPHAAVGSATCDANAKTAVFTMSAQYGQSYDLEIKNLDTGVVRSLDTISSPHTETAMDWGGYSWRVRGVNTYQGNKQNGSWSDSMTFDCLPDAPTISFDAVTAMISYGSTAGLFWKVEAPYDVDCTVKGGGINYSFTHHAPITERLSSDPYQSQSLQNATVFTMSCRPSDPLLSRVATVSKEVRVNVTPKVQER